MKTRQRGASLILILVAVLIAAILWVARVQKKRAEEEAQNEPDVRSIEGMQSAVDRTRNVQEAQKERMEELNRKMDDIDRP